MSFSLYRRVFLVCLAAFCPLLPAFSAPEGAPQQIPPPRPPFIKTPPSGSAWSLVVVYPAEVAASSTRTARLEMRVGTNQVSVGTVLDAEGRKNTYYVVNGHILEKARNTGSVFILSKNRDTDIFDLVAFSFPVVDWVSEKNYVGVEKIGAIAYYKFHQPPDPNPVDPTFNGERTAWIRISDGYPSKVHLDKIVFTFSEVTAYSEAIELPGEYQTVLDQKAAKERVIQLLKRE